MRNVLAVCFLCYFVFLVCRVGATPSFHYIWLFGALLFGAWSFAAQSNDRLWSKFPQTVRIGAEVLVAAGCLLFVVVEGMIAVQGYRAPEGEPAYIIVLGAQVKGKTPSLILQRRVDCAAEYAAAYPDAVIIASGGQGADEEISEAQAIADGLVKQGIARERIRLEQTSVSTKENLEFSKEYLDSEQASVVIVTTDFHVMRAVGIARKLGYKSVQGLAAKGVWYLVPTNYVREFFAVLKDFLVGNLG